MATSADIMLAWVDTGGHVHVTDRHAVGNNVAMWHAWTRAMTITYYKDDPGGGSSPLLYHGLIPSKARGAFTCQSHPPPHKVWDLRADNLPLHDTDHTHYWCKIYCALEVTTKHHMIGLEPLIQPGHESYLHHLVLFYPLTLTISHRWRQTK